MSYRSIPKFKLEKIAEDLRAQRGKFDGKILLVEKLVEGLGFELFPVIGLKEEFGIEAYLPKRPRTIIVDQALMDSMAPRYFFTLAEEVAHSQIHLAGREADLNAFYDWMMSLSNEDYQKFERDAKYLAGALLLPRADFVAEFNKLTGEQKRAFTKAGIKDDQAVIRYALRRIYQAYLVSFECAAFRALNLDLN